MIILNFTTKFLVPVAEQELGHDFVTTLHHFKILHHFKMASTDLVKKI